MANDGFRLTCNMSHLTFSGSAWSRLHQRRNQPCLVETCNRMANGSMGAVGVMAYIATAEM